jgi:hypothetical protein
MTTDRIKFEPLVLTISAFRALTHDEMCGLAARHNVQIVALPCAIDTKGDFRYRYSVEFCQGADVGRFIADFELFPATF